MLPSRVVDGAVGRGLVAARDLDAGVVVARFDGPTVAWRGVPEAEIRHAIWIGPDQWMLPAGDARYVNHSCDPSCDVIVDDADEVCVVTRRPVRAGDELTFDYGAVSAFDASDPESIWDPRWTFRCACGTTRCRGVIDGYVVRAPA